MEREPLLIEVESLLSEALTKLKCGGEVFFIPLYNIMTAKYKITQFLDGEKK